jgi:preflagellin peptidase FlaK
MLYNIIWHKKSKKKTFEGTLATESIGKKIVTLITGYRVSVAKLKEKWHIYPMEDIEADGDGTLFKRKLVVVPKDEGRDEIVGRLSKAVDAGKIDANVWATPGLPMLIFLTLGFVIALLFGDIVWLLVSFAFG